MNIETIKNQKETKSIRKEKRTNKEHINPNLISKELILFDYLSGNLDIPFEDFKIIKQNLENIKTRNEKEKQIRNTLIQIVNLITCDRSLEVNYYFEKIKSILKSPVLSKKNKEILVEWLKKNFIGFLAEKVKNNSKIWYDPKGFKEAGLPIPKQEEFYYISAPGKGEELIELLKKDFPQYNWKNRVLVAELERE